MRSLFRRTRQRITRLGSDAVRALLAVAVSWRRAVSDVQARSRILFVRSPAIGDSLVTLGALEALASSRPGTVIDVIGASELRDLAGDLGFVGRVIAVDRTDRWSYFRAAMRVLRERPYDVVIDAYTIAGAIGVSRACVIAAARAPIRIGGADGVSRRLLTHLVAPPEQASHAILDAYMLVAPLLPTAPIPRGPRLELRATERERALRNWESAPGRGPRVLFNISAGHISREWALENYATILSHLRARRPGARVVVIGHEREAEAADLASRFDAIAITTTFREMIALTATSDLVISPDTSVTHVAAAFQRIVLSIHPANKEKWRPWETRGRAIFGAAGYTLDAVPVAEVLTALDELLATEPELTQ